MIRLFATVDDVDLVVRANGEPDAVDVREADVRLAKRGPGGLGLHFLALTCNDHAVGRTQPATSQPPPQKSHTTSLSC